MAQLYHSKGPFIAALVTAVVIMAVSLVWGIFLHTGAFVLGCIFMFLVSSIRYKGQSLIGGRNDVIDE